MMTITVSQLNRYIKAIFDEDSNLSDLYIKAEISNFKHHTPSGHMYFSLKDETATVRGVMFRGHAEHLKFMPENGMAVLVRGYLGVYERDGTYQVYVTDIQPEGAGTMAVAVRQLREKLEKQGLFDVSHKKALPRYPQKIGVITAETGAAIGDITQVLTRRYPLIELIFHPALVQGDAAVASLVKGIQNLDGHCDVIIIGRGGGSAEDLWAFQDEMLARAIFMAETPIIAAVGHEMDVTICDLVADFRAPTPSAAAELAVPSVEEIRDELLYAKQFIQLHANSLLSRYKKHIAAIAQQPAIQNPRHSLHRKRQRLDFMHKILYNVTRQEIQRCRKQLEKSAALLSSLNPFAVLARGYVASFLNDISISSVDKLNLEDTITLQFSDGQANAVITTIEKKELTYE